MQQNQKIKSPKRVKQLFGTLYSKTRTASKRAYEWSFANALLMTEILAFFIWGLRFQSTRKVANVKKQKSITQMPCFERRDFILDEHFFRDGQKRSALPVSCTTLGTPLSDGHGKITNAIVLLDAGDDQSPSFWLQTHSQDELFGKGKPFDTEKFFHILLDQESSQVSRADLIDLHYRLMNEKLKVGRIQVIAATAQDTVHARLWRETYPEFVTCMHILR